MTARDDALALPLDRLAEYLTANLPGFRGPLHAEKFKGGQSNPTYRIEASSGRYVLRRKPPGELLASAHAVDREFRVLQALHGGAVPVARPLHLCTDTSVIGSMFYVMEFVVGRIFWDPDLTVIAPAERRLVYEQMVDTLAAIHSVDVQAVGLADFGKPGNYFQRQLARWTEQYRASATGEMPAMETLIAGLQARCPGDDGVVSLVHGDYRIDNLMFDDVTTQVRAVVDWELSTLGHPLADLGYLCMALRLPRNPVLPGLGGIDRVAIAVPEEREMLARYIAKTGRDLPADWPFVLAFSFFRLGAIAQGVYKRSLQGNASSDQARRVGAMTALLAEMGVEALD
jgi:aminoglycoside phosphotransferase (APT) family kinase protein